MQWTTFLSLWQSGYVIAWPTAHDQKSDWLNGMPQLLNELV